ncbi:MAG: hypothetical protein V1703_02680 [Candidatus Altiarchaeota archaeon]
MENKKKILVVGAVFLLIFGLIIAVNAVQGIGKEKKGIIKGGCMQWGGQKFANKTIMPDKLGLPENATREQISDAIWEKQLKDVGLTENSTLREYKQTIEAKMKADQQDRSQKIMEKLNLPANATQEDVMNAMKQWHEENKYMLPKNHPQRIPEFGGPVGAGCGKGM